MRACIILHNEMIIDDDHEGSFNENYHSVTFFIAPLINYEAPTSLLLFSHLQTSLIENVWNKYH
jgi:hypothetical protein